MLFDKRILILIFVLFSVSAFGQKKLERADKAYDAGEYFNAIDLYKEVYAEFPGKDERKIEIIFRIANCYRITNQTKKSEMWLKKAIDKGYPNPIIFLYYAEALKMNEKYEEAVEQYKSYRELVPDDRRGDDGIKSCELSLLWKNNPNGYEIEEMKFFNSKFNDFSPCYTRSEFDRILFTSSRPGSEGNDDHGATGQSFTDLYESRRDAKGSWSEPIPLGENINGEFEDGASSMSKDFSTLYYTRCEMSTKKAYGCKIYTTTKSGDEWGKGKDIEIKADSVLIAHPAIAPNDLVLFFVSDMKGSIEEINGKPSKDIWMITRETVGGEWSAPINLGSQINTPGSEVFPYVHADGTLYFSSNGRVGMGGLDIFKATQDENGNWMVENMRYPINSPKDDFGITFEHDVERGFLSSARGTRDVDNIYSFYLPPLKFSITGVVKDQKTEENIAGASVKSISSDGITLESKTDKDGKFKFILKPSTDYVFVVSKRGDPVTKKGDYLNGKYRETTKNKSQSEDFNALVYLQPTDAPIEVEDIFYEYDDTALRPESIVSLDKLVETLNDNPTITIELMAHTDPQGNDQYNMRLSQGRANSVVYFLTEKGIDPDRLEAKGYGETKPVKVNKTTMDKYPFLFEGDVLTEDFIEKLSTDEQKQICYQLNRRTEFQVLRSDYISK